MSAGAASTCARNDDGALWCFGSNSAGQLGLSEASVSLQSPPAQVAADLEWATFSVGARHVLAITTDGRLFGWGDNGRGQLGDDDAMLYEPVAVVP